MAYEDVNKSYIETLISNREWQSAYNALCAYIEKNGNDYWAKNQMALVKSNLSNL